MLIGAPCRSFNVTKDVASAKHTLTSGPFQLITAYTLKPAQPPAFEATRALPRSLGVLTGTHSLHTGATGLEHITHPLPRVRACPADACCHARCTCNPPHQRSEP